MQNAAHGPKAALLFCNAAGDLISEIRKKKNAKFGKLLFYLHSYENIIQSHVALLAIQKTVLFVPK